MSKIKCPHSEKHYNNDEHPSATEIDGKIYCFTCQKWYEKSNVEVDKK